VGRHRLQYVEQVARTQKLTVIQQGKERLATIPDGKLPTNPKIEGEEEEVANYPAICAPCIMSVPKHKQL
jgi:hypothetical protein